MSVDDTNAGVVCTTISSNKLNLPACLTIFHGLGIDGPFLAFPAIAADVDFTKLYFTMLSSTCRYHVFITSWVSSMVPTETISIAATNCSSAVAAVAAAAAAADGADAGARARTGT